MKHENVDVGFSSLPPVVVIIILNLLYEKDVIAVTSTFLYWYNFHNSDLIWKLNVILQLFHILKDCCLQLNMNTLVFFIMKKKYTALQLERENHAQQFVSYLKSQVDTEKTNLLNSKQLLTTFVKRLKI